MDRCTSWVKSSACSDHLPIVLRLDSSSQICNLLLKNCLVWAEEAEFQALVRNHWFDFYGQVSGTAMHGIPLFLRSLKHIVSPWLKSKKLSHKQDLVHLEALIEEYYCTAHLTSATGSGLDYIKSLEREKFELLQADEDIWHLKSKALWISLGDQNNIFFHSYANQRWKHNAIWEISVPCGVNITSHHGIE